MSPRDSKRINALYALWGLLAPLAVLAWFGARELWESHPHFELAPAAPNHILATSVGAPPAQPPGTWEVHCYASATEPSDFLPAERSAPAILPAHLVVGDDSAGTALLASTTNASNLFRLHPDPSPLEDTGHEYPLFCP